MFDPHRPCQLSSSLMRTRQFRQCAEVDNKKYSGVAMAFIHYLAGKLAGQHDNSLDFPLRLMRRCPAGNIAGRNL